MRVENKIAELLNCTIEHAQEIRDYMDDWLDLDYSECTTKQFNETARLALTMMANERAVI
jgi:hypothetical protein